MDFFEVLVILAFIVLPLLEGVFRQRKGRGQAPGPAPRPEREPERERERERERAASRVPAGGRGGFEPGPRDAQDDRPGAEDPAAGMIPAELWEILTGERRPGTVPGPEPVPAPSPWETSEEEEEESVTSPWESPAERWEESRGSSEGASAEGESIEYVGPEAVSLEQMPPPPEVRHRLFHQRYDAPAPAVSGGPQPSALVRDLRAGLRDQGLRRSVVLAEILGAPKGLS